MCADFLRFPGLCLFVFPCFCLFQCLLWTCLFCWFYIEPPLTHRRRRRRRTIVSIVCCFLEAASRGVNLKEKKKLVARFYLFRMQNSMVAASYIYKGFSFCVRSFFYFSSCSHLVFPSIIFLLFLSTAAATAAASFSIVSLEPPYQRGQEDWFSAP